MMNEMCHAGIAGVVGGADPSAQLLGQSPHLIHVAHHAVRYTDSKAIEGCRRRDSRLCWDHRCIMQGGVIVLARSLRYRMTRWYQKEVVKWQAYTLQPFEACQSLVWWVSFLHVVIASHHGRSHATDIQRIQRMLYLFNATLEPVHPDNWEPAPCHMLELGSRGSVSD